MVAVFAAFAVAGAPALKELGVGLAVAILLDATLVRLVIVPAAMRLLGDWNWWLPGSLARVLPARAH
jgi:RND superfamily putative drug exporter